MSRQALARWHSWLGCSAFTPFQLCLPKLRPLVEMPWTTCNLVTGHIKYALSLNECQENVRKSTSRYTHQALNLLKTGDPKQGSCQTNNHVCHRQKKKRTRAFILLRYLVWFDTQQQRSSIVRHWSKNNASPPWSMCVCVFVCLCVWVVVTPYKRLGKISDILHLNNKNNQLERWVRPPKDIH